VREAAADRAFAAGRHRVEEVAQLRDDEPEVAVHGQDQVAGGGGVAVAQRAPHPAGRLASE